MKLDSMEVLKLFITRSPIFETSRSLFTNALIQTVFNARITIPINKKDFAPNVERDLSLQRRRIAKT